ncbi:unnamed protein product [Somion occarium]|uniref:E3 ubiquitin-protein ligase SHPRH n=1 Tax=Somion occarium TaxID=3059160 RepID=A0ABP1CSU6_9APHY
MRTAVTHHALPLREVEDGAVSCHLHIDVLFDLIHAKAQEEWSGQAKTGKKRAVSPTPESPRKRLKADSTVDANGAGALEVHDDRLTMPVYKHTFILQYNTVPASNDIDGDVDEDWHKQEHDFKQWLDEHRARDSPLHLGRVAVQRGFGNYGRLEVCAREYGPQLFMLPQLDTQADMTDYDIRSLLFRDPLFAIKRAGWDRFSMDAHLKLEMLDLSKIDKGTLPFRLHLEVVVSLLLPGACMPFQYGRYTTKGHSADEEEAHRRVVTFLFCPEQPLPEQFNGKVDIPLLFSILGPAPALSSHQADEALQPPALVPTLLPFQRRSVAWLLSREGKRITPTGDIVPLEQTDDSNLPLFWQVVTSEAGHKIYVNRIRGQISITRPDDDDPLGGILAEEPGLGKTLECIALILLNPAVGRNPTTKSWDPVAKIDVREVQTTLIVTPASLAPQWADELTKHAPTLKVLIYEGWSKVKVPISEADVEAAREQRAKTKKKSKARAARAYAATKGKTFKGPSGRGQAKQADDDSDFEIEDPEIDQDEEDDIVDWCTYVSRYDVCITTYNVLQQDLGVARPPPVRPRRANTTYNNVERSRSPLIMCEWYRVIMDEVQMVGGGRAELSSFAVSGTPARAQISDLIHVLKFLRVSEVISYPRIWTRLLKPGFVHEFVQLFNRYAIRTMKATVKDELTIPRQTRYLVPIELGRVERHVYDQHFEKALLDLGLDARGVAVTDDWEADTGVLRTWLRKLRGICTHPQVGQLLYQNDKLSRPGVLKSIGEVLEGMKEQNWRNYMEDRRNKLQTHTLLVQLKQHDEADLNRYRNALDILLFAEKEAHNLIADIQEALEEHAAKGKMLKTQALEAQTAFGRDVANPDDSEDDSMEGKGKSRARESTPSDISMDSEDADVPKNAAGEEHAHKRRALQQRLRECQISLHKVYFLKGDVYHVLGATFSDSENDAYASAEELRRLLLKSTEDAAKRAMAQLVRDAAKKGLHEDELFIDVPYFDKGGIRSHELMEEANEKIDELLNEQSALLWRWRTRLIGLLTQSLTSGDDDADGQEYSRSLETQGEAETYLQAYAALLADRREALTSERTLLAAHDVKEKKARLTKAAKKAAAAALEDEVLMQIGDIDPQPEHQVLQQQLNEERKHLLEDFNSSRALRSVMVDLNNVAARIIKDEDPEKIIAKDAASRLRQLLLEQAKMMDKLQADLTLLRKAFNERISYFRQLQELSDTVAEAEWEGTLAEAIARAQLERTVLEVRIVTGRARQRYLDNLAKSQEEGATSEDDECCILCKCEFSRGYITQCAHVFCESCMKAWLERKEGKACPVCRVAIQPDQLQRFAVAGSGPQAQATAPVRIVNNEPVPRSRREIKYNLIDSGLFDSIQMMESHGSYGSKIETLVRHLLYVQAADPGSKTIVFSAWADSLHIIEHALKHNDIPCLRIDQNSSKQNAAKKFRTDPAIQVLLLHGERENAGLNVTCASRVILVESVVNHAFELQAIARIDRMGQTRPTEVYCYYAEETVERNILDLAARQGLSLYTEDKSAGTLDVEPLKAAMRPMDKNEVDAPTKKVQKGDFVFKTDDMLAIFFPHLFEDIEYLITPDDTEARSSRHTRFDNAVAGPSRLP